MKKLLLPAVLFINLIVHAQFMAGIGVGVSSNCVSKPGNLTIERTTQLSGGLLLDYQFPASGLHFQSGILYTPMGYGKSQIPATSPDSLNYGMIASHHVGYVQIPAWFNYGSMSINFAFRAGIGPFIAFKTNDKVKIVSGDSFGNGTSYPINTSGLSPVIAGAGIHLSGNFYHYQISIEYQQGLTSMYKKNINSTSKWLNNSFGIHLGYFFRGNSGGF
jgi:hypothetical protein